MSQEPSHVADVIKGHIHTARTKRRRLGRNMDYYFGCDVAESTAESIGRLIAESMSAEDGAAFLAACGIAP